MIRTQIYLPKVLYHWLQLEAQEKQVPKAELIRALLQRGLHDQTKETAGQALLRLSQINARGPKDLSVRIDDYLYGDEN